MSLCSLLLRLLKTPRATQNGFFDFVTVLQHVQHDEDRDCEDNDQREKSSNNLIYLNVSDLYLDVLFSSRQTQKN